MPIRRKTRKVRSYKRRRTLRRKKSVKRKRRSVGHKKRSVRRKRKTSKKQAFLVFSAAGSPGTLVQLQARGIQDIHLTGTRSRYGNPRRTRIASRSAPRFVRRLPKRITTLSKQDRRRLGSVFI